jgi:hypothetical protein
VSIRASWIGNGNGGGRNKPGRRRLGGCPPQGAAIRSENWKGWPTFCGLFPKRMTYV